jgi:hypothetical protein
VVAASVGNPVPQEARPHEPAAAGDQDSQRVSRARQPSAISLTIRVSGIVMSHWG